MRLVLFVLALLGGWSVVAQAPSGCDCAGSLDEVSRRVDRLPAYRRNCRDGSCADTLAVLRDQSAGVTGALACYRLLVRYVRTLGDGHTAIYGTNTDTTYRREFAYPVAVTEPQRRLYGWRGGVYALFPERDGVLALVVERPGSSNWRPGELVGYLVPAAGGRTRFVGRHPRSRRLINFEEDTEDAGLNRLRLYWRADDPDYATQLPVDERYAYRQLDDRVDYLRLGSFSGFHPVLGEAEAFYASLPQQLTGTVLIVDVRNNGGGGDRNSDLVYRILRARRKQYRRVYVLVNELTASNAEQFALRFANWKQARLAGQRTAGVIAYEVKGGGGELACGPFVLQVASKRIREYLPYETVGIAPEVVLSPERDWIDQLLERADDSATN